MREVTSRQVADLISLLFHLAPSTMCFVGTCGSHKYQERGRWKLFFQAHGCLGLLASRFLTQSRRGRMCAGCCLGARASCPSGERKEAADTIQSCGHWDRLSQRLVEDGQAVSTALLMKGPACNIEKEAWPSHVSGQATELKTSQTSPSSDHFLRRPNQRELRCRDCLVLPRSTQRGALFVVLPSQSPTDGSLARSCLGSCTHRTLAGTV